jgi:hypothetical protein
MIETVRFSDVSEEMEGWKFGILEFGRCENTL